MACGALLGNSSGLGLKSGKNQNKDSPPLKKGKLATADGQLKGTQVSENFSRSSSTGLVFWTMVEFRQSRAFCFWLASLPTPPVSPRRSPSAGSPRCASVGESFKETPEMRNIDQSWLCSQPTGRTPKQCAKKRLNI